LTEYLRQLKTHYFSLAFNACCYWLTYAPVFTLQYTHDADDDVAYLMTTTEI